MKSINFQLGSANLPKIRTGGSSDTNTLNRYFQALSEDMATITYEFLDLIEVNQDLKIFADLQANGFQNVLTSIESRVASITPTGQVLADPSSTNYIHGSNTASLSGKYGQATLPIATSNDLLFYQDVYGNNYVPENIRVVWDIVTKGTDPILNASEPAWEYDDSIERAILGTGPWIRNFSHSSSASNSTIWIKIELPFRYQTQRPNVLEFIPLPVFSHKLIGVYYSSSINEVSSNWVKVDTDYLLGYNPDIYGNEYVNNVGPTRLFLPNTDISSIMIGFRLSSAGYYGLSSINLKHVTFDTNAEYVVQNPYGNISGISILGKDPNDLATLSQSINTNSATITLGTADPSETPVITGVIMETL